MKYFTIEELCRSEKAIELKIKNQPNSEAVENMRILIEECLDPIREKWGAPLIVNSGYRCPQLNKAVNGSNTSDHLKGRAADLIPIPNTKENRIKLLYHIKKCGVKFWNIV